MQFSSPTKTRHGFTLVEILVVIAIIAILSALTVGIGGNVMEKQMVSRAESEMDRIAQALNLYKDRYFEYPAMDADPEVLLSLSASLMAKYDATGADISMKNETPFIGDELTYDDDPDNEIPDGTLVDPWGNPYYYFYVTRSGMLQKTEDRQWGYPGFILYSQGPDVEGIDSLSDEIKTGIAPDMTAAIQAHFEQDGSYDDLVHGFDFE